MNGLHPRRLHRLPAAALVGATLSTCVHAQAPTPITYFVAEGDPESGYLDTDRELAVWALEAWAAHADPRIPLVVAPEDSATVRVYWVRAGDGLYGETRMMEVDGRVVAAVFVRPDVRGLGPDIEAASARDPLFRDTVVYLTCVHELGHAFGLPHTSSFADIMYTFQHGGDLAAYFMRFRDQVVSRGDVRTANPFSEADLRAFGAARR